MNICTRIFKETVVYISQLNYLEHNSGEYKHG